MPLGGLAPCPLPLGGTKLDGLTAEQHARICADLRAAVATAPFAVLHADTSGVIHAYTAQHGVGVLAAPAIAVVAPNEAVLTWEPSYLDEYDNAQATYIKHAVATGRIAPFVSPLAVATILTPRSVRVRTYLSTGAGVAADFSLVVW